MPGLDTGPRLNVNTNDPKSISQVARGMKQDRNWIRCRDIFLRRLSFVYTFKGTLDLE